MGTHSIGDWWTDKTNGRKTWFIQTSSSSIYSTSNYEDFALKLKYIKETNKLENLLDTKYNNARTFKELLERNRKVNCDIIIGRMKLHCPLRWTKYHTLTKYCYDTYKDLLNAPIEFWESGMLEVYYKYWRKGNRFVLQVAGFGDPEDLEKLFNIKRKK